MIENSINVYIRTSNWPYCCCTVQLLSLAAGPWMNLIGLADFFTKIIPRIFFTSPRFIKVTTTTFDQYKLQYIPLMEQFHKINQSMILTPKMYENVQMFYCWLVQVYIFSIFLWSLFCQWGHFLSSNYTNYTNVYRIKMIEMRTDLPF